jgi:Uma2 family endonuclease
VATDSSSIIYPESDGLPMSDNTRQLRWIVTLYGNLAALFRAVADVFVGGNQYWYPVEGHPELRIAPDVYVAFGRPKGDRPSYKQWEEGDVPLTVVFEILSPGNTGTEMIEKFAFYDEHGVEEYYIYDPDKNRLWIYVRRRETLVAVRPVAGFVSPRLGIRFDLSGPEMVVYGPGERPFLTFEELEAERSLEHQQRLAAQQRAEQAEQRAEQAEQRAEQEKQRAGEEREQRLAALERAGQAEQRAARLAELSRKARQQQASPEELAELERLEQQAPTGS